MTIQDTVAAIDTFFEMLATGIEHTKYLKDAIHRAKNDFDAIKDKIRVDAKVIEEDKKGSPQRKEESGKGNSAQTGHHENTTINDLQKENELLKKENKTLQQELKDLSNRIGEEKLRQVDKLNKEKKTLQKEVEELTTRLSSVTGQQLTQNNPNIADLSDPYRPTKLVEGFRLLYDNEWTDAFSSFDKGKSSENEIITLLSVIIKRADKFCTDSFQQLTERMQNYVTDDISDPNVKIDGKDLRCTPDCKVALETSHVNLVKGHINNLMKALADVSGKQLADIFSKLPMERIKKDFMKKEMQINFKHIHAFAGKAVKLIWMMKVQQPPMELIWSDPGTKYVKEMFSFYVSKGETVVQCIWPAVLLHKDGPLMARGIVQGQ